MNTTTTHHPTVVSDLLRAAQDLQRQGSINAALLAVGHAAALPFVWNRDQWRYFLIAFGVLWLFTAIRRWRAFRELRDRKNPVANTMLEQPHAIQRVEGWPRGAKRPPFLSFIAADGATLRIRVRNRDLPSAAARLRDHFQQANIDIAV